MRMLVIASLAAISACTASANPPLLGEPDQPALAYDSPSDIYGSPGEVSCDVRAIRTAHGVRFEAIAFSDAGASGEYELVITKRDRDGASDIMQGGEYDLLAGDAQSLGSAELSVARGGAYSARLVLHDQDGIACNAELSR